MTAALFRLRERNDSRGLRVLSVALRFGAEQAAAPSPHRRADRAISNPLESLQVTNEQYDTRMGAFRGLSVTINSGTEHNTNDFGRPRCRPYGLTRLIIESMFPSGSRKKVIHSSVPSGWVKILCGSLSNFTPLAASAACEP